MQDQLPLQDVLAFRMPTIEIVDVGAAPERPDRYEPLVERGLARVAAFEPREEALDELKGRGAAYRHFPHFLADGRPRTFHETSWPGCSSLYEPDPEMIDLFTSIGVSKVIEGDQELLGNFHVNERRTVETRKLDEFADSLHPDYIKVDVQGAELEVLQNGTAVMASAVVIEAETEFVPIYKGQPLFCDIQAFLREQGFLLHKLIDVSGRAFRPMRIPDQPNRAISQLLWADAVFVRDFRNLDRFTDEQLLKVAMIAYDVYTSVDLAHYFLNHYDRRAGSNLGTRLLRYVESGPQFQQLFVNERYDF